MNNHCHQQNNASGLLLNEVELSDHIAYNLFFFLAFILFSCKPAWSPNPTPQPYSTPPLLSLCYLIRNVISLIHRFFN